MLVVLMNVDNMWIPAKAVLLSIVRTLVFFCMFKYNNGVLCTYMLLMECNMFSLGILLCVDYGIEHEAKE